METLDVLRPIVDKTIRSLATARFRSDPIGGDKYSRQTSIISSAYKRHGQILEIAIRQRLSESQYFTVWHEPLFRVSDLADRAIRGRNEEIPAEALIELPYAESGRSIQVDAFVYDRRVRTLRAYEIKRGNGDFDAGKKRSILRDVLSIQSLLRGYGKLQALDCSITEARLICYYGVRALPQPLCLVADEMDDHFVFRVKEHVERVNTYFRDQLFALLEDIERQHRLTKGTLCEACPFGDKPNLH